MAKKRKTKQEKIIADLRRKLESSTISQETPVTSTGVYSLPPIKPKIFIPTNNLSAGRQGRPRATSNYTYVLSDLKKTIVLTGIALLIQVLLYFVLKR